MPISAEGHSDADADGDFHVDGSSFWETAGDFFSTGRISELTDLALFDLLLNFSPLPAMTNSGWSLSSLLCLRLMMNQKRANEATKTTMIGTAIAGTKVFRFDDDAGAAVAVDDEVAEAVEEGSVLDEVLAEAASADVIEAYSRGSIIVLVLTEVTVLGLGEVKASVCVSVIVVSAAGASAETTEAVADGSATIFDGTIVAGSVAVGFPILEGRLSRSVLSCLLRRAKATGSILPACIPGRIW